MKLRSLKQKILLLVICILFLLAFTFMIFSKRNVENAMLAAEERSALNVLQLVTLNIDASFENLLWEKMATIKRRKAETKALSDIFLAGIEEYANLADKGTLDQDVAKKLALKWIARMDGDDQQYGIIYGNDNTILYYPEKELVGRDMSHLRDIKGRPLFDAAREEARKKGHAFSTFIWDLQGRKDPIKKFAHFRYFPQWGWTVGASNYVGDVEIEMQRKLDEHFATLKQTIANVHFADTGYVFIFNAQKKILLAPEQDREQLATAINILDNKNLLDDLIEAAHSDSKDPVYHKSNSADAEEMESYVAYFKPLKWYICTNVSTREIHQPARELLTRQSMITSAALALSLILGLLFANKISKPLVRLSEYAKSLSETDLTADRTEEPPIADLAEMYKDEVGHLAETFLSMETSLRTKIRELMDVTASKQRIEHELHIARSIQMGLLPKVFPPPPSDELKEVQLFAFLEPAKQVGGDLYDFFFLDKTHLFFSVGDVSDKGVPAALFMAITKTLVKLMAESYDDPALIMSKVNNALSTDNPNSMFVTMIIGILDMQTGDITYCNAGHNLPVIFSPTRKAAFLEGISGPIAGAMEDMPYVPLHTELKPGETIFLYTDGVTEAANCERELFSDERLLQVTDKLNTKAPKDVINGVMDAINEHAAGFMQWDDITMLCIRFYGPSGNTIDK